MATKIEDMTKSQLNDWLSKYWHKLTESKRIELTMFCEAMEA